MLVRYCASDQLKVGESSRKFAPVIATGGYQEVHNVIGRIIFRPILRHSEFEFPSLACVAERVEC